MSRIAYLLFRVLGDEDARKILWIVLAAVLGILLLAVLVIGAILAGMLYIVNPHLLGDVADNVHYQAIQEVKQEYAIANDFDLSYLIMIDLLHDHSLMRQKGEIISFLEDHFVMEHEETMEVDEEPKDTSAEAGEGDSAGSATETITYYLFAEGAELMTVLFAPPFSFGDEQLEVIRHMIYSSSPESGELVFHGKYPMPLNGRVTSGYGPRTHPVTGEPDFHTGIDIQGTWHSSVMSIADGVVEQVGRDEWYGYYILIRHQEENRSFYSFYAHLSRQTVRVGQRVRQGQVIGLEGGDPIQDPYPGLSTGHHLHFGIYANTNRNSHLDPTEFLHRKEEFHGLEP
jgi:murein DD-endopeptidase MepM/ murein hydrolase activator NlpD